MATIDMTAASVAESAKLQRHFGRFDILFFLICTIVGVDTIATVAEGGGQAFTWMMVFALVFFVPQALLFAELGTAFPQEGGPYLWTRLAFGHLAGAVNDFLYWITNPVWIGGSLTASCIGAVVIFFNHGNSLSDDDDLRGGAGLRLDHDRLRHRVVPLRQVAAHGGRVRPVPGARPVHRHRRHLRGQARRARPRGRRATSPRRAGSCC